MTVTGRDDLHSASQKEQKQKTGNSKVVVRSHTRTHTRCILGVERGKSPSQWVCLRKILQSIMQKRCNRNLHAFHGWVSHRTIYKSGSFHTLNYKSGSKNSCQRNILYKSGSFFYKSGSLFTKLDHFMHLITKVDKKVNTRF